MRQFQWCSMRAACSLILACLLCISVLLIRFNDGGSEAITAPAHTSPIREVLDNQVAPVPAPSPTESKHSDRPSDVFYERAMRLYNADAAHELPQTLHLIRVPKAGSTATSVVARRLAGCTPAGPCCLYPGIPAGTCPQPGLMCPNIVGCTGHHAHMEAFMSSEIPSLMMMRHPISRALSAFFYPGVHHNSECRLSHDECFQEYMASNRWRNIAVKMLTGASAYVNVQTCVQGCRQSLEAALANLGNATFVGVSELWELSILLFHSTFPGFKPERSEFSLGVSGESESSSHEKLPFDVRTNMNEAYLNFRKTARQVYGPQLEANNEPDMRLYQFVVKLMCSRVRERGLWDDYVAKYWAEHIDIPCEESKLW